MEKEDQKISYHSIARRAFIGDKVKTSELLERVMSGDKVRIVHKSNGFLMTLTGFDEKRGRFIFFRGSISIDIVDDFNYIKDDVGQQLSLKKSPKSLEVKLNPSVVWYYPIPKSLDFIY